MTEFFQNMLHDARDTLTDALDDFIFDDEDLARYDEALSDLNAHII